MEPGPNGLTEEQLWDAMESDPVPIPPCHIETDKECHLGLNRACHMCVIQRDFDKAQKDTFLRKKDKI